MALEFYYGLYTIIISVVYAYLYYGQAKTIQRRDDYINLLLSVNRTVAVEAEKKIKKVITAVEEIGKKHENAVALIDHQKDIIDAFVKQYPQNQIVTDTRKVTIQ